MNPDAGSFTLCRYTLHFYVCFVALHCVNACVLFCLNSARCIDRRATLTSLNFHCVPLSSSLLTLMLQQEAHSGAAPFPRFILKFFNQTTQPSFVHSRYLYRGSPPLHAHLKGFNLDPPDPWPIIAVWARCIPSQHSTNLGPFWVIWSLSSSTTSLEFPRSHGSGQHVTMSTFSVLPSP